MHNTTVIQVTALSISAAGKRFIEGLSFDIQKGEQWAIVGPSGSGKTSLLYALAGAHHYSGKITIHTGNNKHKAVFIEQQHRFRNLSNTSSFYYQQRFNSSDAEDAITVEQDLLNTIAVEHTTANPQRLPELLKRLNIEHLLGVRLIQLSNGENKRLQIAKALLAGPTFLLMDNPLIGLDVASRATLTALLDDIARDGIQVIMVTGYNQVPDFITHVLELDQQHNYPVLERKTFLQTHRSHPEGSYLKHTNHSWKSLPAIAENTDFEFAVRMKDVQVKYNNRQILHNISWEVRKEERWSLSGPNGSGKSTLLSLVNADNPQAYSNEIYLFGRKRGTGESIWDIKKRIGFVSPELHLYFDGSINCFDVIASGLFDTIGLFRKLNDEQVALVAKWMDMLQITHLGNSLLSRLPNSQQRMVLLARALVKNPPLLILDEPCQGLDDGQVSFFKGLVDEICLETGKTLIYVSHYPQEIPGCVTRFIKLENGKATIQAL